MTPENRPHTNKFWIPVYVSIVFNVFALFLFLAEASFRHSGAAPTPKSILMLFPLPVALGPTIGPPLAVLLGLIQFPTYGILLGTANEKDKFAIRFIQIALFHGVLATAAIWVSSI